MKHLCPGAGMKAGGVRMQCDDKIPTRVVDGIDNPNSNRFTAGLSFDQRIVATDRACFRKWPIVYFDSVQIYLPRLALPHHLLRQHNGQHSRSAPASVLETSATIRIHLPAFPQSETCLSYNQDSGTRP